MEDYQVRVVDEKSALDAKIAALGSFLDGAVYASMDDQSKYLMVLQYTYMKNYSSVLEARIETFPVAVAPEPGVAYVNPEVLVPVVEPVPAPEFNPEDSPFEPYFVPNADPVVSDPVVDVVEPEVQPHATPEELGVVVEPVVEQIDLAGESVARFAPE